MKGIKGLFGICGGITYVVIFLGLSSLFTKNSSYLYDMRFGEYLFPPVVMSIGWLVGSMSLVALLGQEFTMGINARKTIFFLTFGLLHVIGSFCMFFFRNHTVSFLIICAILIMYLVAFSGVQRVYPRFFVINFVYFLWICLILAQNYFLLIFN